MTVLLLLAVLVLVLLNGFFVAAEFALVRVRRSRIEEEVEEGVKGARLVLTQLDDLSRYLAACQLGITLTSLGIGFLGEPAIASIFENLFGEERPALGLLRRSRWRSPTSSRPRCTSRSASRSRRSTRSTRPSRSRA